MIRGSGSSLFRACFGLQEGDTGKLNKLPRGAERRGPTEERESL
jgi:hypothetical protein